MPDAYERWLGPAVFAPFAADLASRVAARRPRRVLELAAGTGIVTRALLAAVDGAAVTATDLNEAMVEFGDGNGPGSDVAPGRRAGPAVRRRRVRRRRLPVRRDVLPRQGGGLRRSPAGPRARRVVVLQHLGTVDTHDFAVALIAGLEKAFPEDPPTFLGAVPHGYADLDAVTADLRRGGLEPVSVETVTLEGRGHRRRHRHRVLHRHPAPPGDRGPGRPGRHRRHRHPGDGIPPRRRPRSPAG